MSIIALITIGIILVFVIGIIIYALHEYKEDLKDIKEIQRHRSKKDSLLMDYYRVVDRIPGVYNPQYFRKVLTWTDAKESEIYEKGYMQAEKWSDDLRYIGVKIYVRMHGFKLPEEPSKITSSVLYNVYSSRSVNKFISGITKINFNSMDMKTLAVIIPVAIGIALGMFYFLGMK